MEVESLHMLSKCSTSELRWHYLKFNKQSREIEIEIENLDAQRQEWIQKHGPAHPSIGFSFLERTNAQAQLREFFYKKKTLTHRLENVKSFLARVERVRQEIVCRNVCDCVSTKLPRELRDMIYRHLLDQELVKVDFGFLVARGYLAAAFVPFEEARKINSDLIAEDLHWNASITGNNFQHELTELWYTEATFDLGTNARYGDMVLKLDRRTLGFTPSNLIRHLQCDVEPKVAFSSGSYQLVADGHNLLQCLELLPRKITLTITLKPLIGNGDWLEMWEFLYSITHRGWAYTHARQYRKMIASLMPTVLSYRHAGHTVEIIAPGWKSFSVSTFVELSEPDFEVWIKTGLPESLRTSFSSR
ncbi:hypothetical protein TUN199_05524 [Pyrenophora tritici-repentis]|uniref:Uncharacterized protein n=1 Tax=Pyrenophora tritici-repentis TaxID=45151 RepID=A0A2W1FPV0_9PLEO|nr:hypothetical protein A1F99_104570 [Pyrenophora tritici-repentis]KAF7565741.1 hypothetical protein PtrM4_051750 [Pyrenophora tritici-repentis]KAI0574905.1 hypothetical protein Alg215_08319 [Pyrenophora tritici-repentis]KAI0583772.1 hypothetical protein Alg130_05511 [Pyrenophora tritici-repentis]KAI0622500.1 hypothetical protein TUN199_05524 [Pyrenophora tritici-repentis]